MLQALGQVIFEVLGPIIILATAGYLLRRYRPVDVRSVSRIVFYILAPCLVYTSIVNLEFEADTVWRIMAFAAAQMAIMATLAIFLTRRWGYSGSLGGAFVMTTILLNNGNYGLPLNLFAFGETGFGYALLLFMFNSLVGSTIGIYLMARGENGGRTALRRTLQTPIVWAMLAGFFSRLVGIQPTGTVMEMLDLAGRSSIPVFLIILGMSLAQADARLNFRPVLRLTTLRMFGGAGLGIILASLFGLSGLAYNVAILQASMPTAVNAIVLSNEFEAAPDFVAGAVFITTLVSVITLPTLLLWLT